MPTILIAGFLYECLGALLWGVGGYACFRLLGGKDRRWYVGALGTSMLAALAEFVGYLTLRSALDSLPSAAGNSMVVMGPAVFNSVVKGALVLPSFKIGQLLLRRRTDAIVEERIVR